MSSEMTANKYKGHSSVVWQVKWSPDGKQIASSGGLGDDSAQVWDATTGGNPFTYSKHTDYVYAVTWSPDGQYIASASADHTVQVWPAHP